MMHIKDTIETKLQIFQPHYLQVINESHKHNVPKGSESHFKVIIVSDEFQGKMPVTRHRMVNNVLADEIAEAIHALVLNTMTIEEWSARRGVTNNSPPCLGGSSGKQT
ncbi:MAG: BolA/IbaG family iron-sulfur metabolism protein [Nitrosomonas sp.]|nr:BolA/IbaG family iron-sulfur metabolism protein [Nitrosomonas sp.]MCW5606779.1 BolA/IbaG family iron-sulfur metabolism protein [Nitrosomonas sp.]